MEPTIFEPTEWANKALIERREQESAKRIGRYKSGPTLRASQDLSTEFENEYGEIERIGGCTRALFFRTKGIPRSEETDILLARKALKGERLHELEQQLHEEAGILLASEEDVAFTDPDTKISGRPDEILFDPHQKQIWVHEIKSVSGMYQGGKGTIYRVAKAPFMPKAPHVLQVIIYLYQYPTLSSLTKAMYRNHLAYQTAYLAGDLMALPRERIDLLWRRLARADRLLRVEGDLPVVGAQITYFDRASEEWSRPPHEVRLLADGSIMVNDRIQKYNLPNVLDRAVRALEAAGGDELPDRDFQLEYDKERLDKLASTGRLGKGQMADWKKGTLSMGDFACRYCDWRGTCWGR